MKADLALLPVFIALAETGSFTDAAGKVHLTRSAVSKVIARLEQQIGIQLFFRTTRRVSLTPEGMQYYEHCKNAVSGLSLAETLLEAGRMEVSGRLSVSVPVLFGLSRVAPILTEFARSHPHLNLAMSFSDRIADLFEDKLDLAVRIGTLSDRESGQLMIRRLCEHEMVFCASPDYLATVSFPRTIDELLACDCVAYDRSGIRQGWRFLGKDGRETVVEPDSKYLMDDFQAILQLVRSGYGVAWLPDFLIDTDLEAGSLTKLLPDLQSVTYPISVVWKKSAPLPLKIRLIIDRLVAELATL